MNFTVEELSQKKQARMNLLFNTNKKMSYAFFSERYLSASIAAIQPEPAAVTACR